MTRLLLILAIWLFCIPVKAQDCYAPLRAKGDAFAKKGQYEKAINMYLAAMNCPERELGDNLTAEIQKSLDARVKQLAQARNKAQENELKAVEALKTAERKTREAIANDLAQKINQEPDYTTAIRLAEFANKVDPDNPKIIKELLRINKIPRETILPSQSFAGHLGHVTALACSPDGKMVVSGTLAGEVIGWDIQSRKELFRYSSEDLQVWDIEISPNGQHIAALKHNWHGDVRFMVFSPSGEMIKDIFWDRKSRDPNGFYPTNHSLTFSTDNRLIYFKNDEGFTVMDVETLNYVQENYPPARKYFVIDFPPDSPPVVSNYSPQQELKDSQELWYAESFSTDSSLAVVKLNPDFEIVLVLDLERMQIFKQYKDVRHITLGNRDDLIAVHFNDGRTIVQRQNDVFELNGNTDNIGDMTFIPYGDILFTASNYERTFRQWGLGGILGYYFTLGGTYNVEEEFVSGKVAKGEKLFLENRDKNIMITKIAEAGNWETTEIKGGTEPENQILFYETFLTKNGKFIGYKKGREFLVYDIEHQKDIFTMPVPEQYDGNALTISSDGSLLAFGQTGQALVWDTKTKSLKASYFEIGDPDDNTITDLLFSPDNKKLAVVKGTISLSLIDLEDKEPIIEMAITAEQNSDITTLNFSPDGNYIITSSSFENDLKVWDTATGEFIGTHSGHKGRIYSIEFSNDSKKVFSFSGNTNDHPGTARVWDLKTGKLLYEISTACRGCHDAVLSPDEKVIRLYSGNDGYMEIEISAESLIKELAVGCGHLTNYMVEKHELFDSFVYAGFDAEALIEEGNEARMLHIAEHYLVQGKRRGRSEGRYDLYRESRTIFEALKNIAVLHPRDFYERRIEDINQLIADE